MMRIEAVTGTDSVFAAFTYPRFRPLLGGNTTDATGISHPDNRVEAYGAMLDGQPVGLVLLRYRGSTTDAAPNAVRLLSVMVAKTFRRRGIGTALIERAISAARSIGASELMAYHSDRMQDREGFETFLQSIGWSAPSLAEFRLAGHADWTERAVESWMPMLQQLALRGYSSSPWSTVSDADRLRAETLVPDGTNFDFRRFEPYCDPNISIALRRHGELVGWVLGESPRTEAYHHYTNGYVIPELQHFGWLAAGIYDVCRAQMASYGPKSTAIYETFGANTRMIAFMKRRMRPFTLWMDERYETRFAVTK